MSSVIALREKLLTAGLIVVLLATVLVTRRQQLSDANRSVGVLPHPPAEQELQRAFPVAPLDVEALAATEEFAAYTPLVEQDPFVRIKTVASDSQPAQRPETAPSALSFRGRVVLGGRQVAIIEVVASKETLFVGVGQEVEGFKVIDIDEERVVLSKSSDQQQVTLRLPDDAARKGD